MATFFTKVPRELRDKVYHELLRADDTLDPDRRLLRGGTSSEFSNQAEKLYPAIMRVCKQAQAEASIVLYGQNHLRFEITRYFDMQPNLSPYSKMIRHLEVNFTRFMRGGEYHIRTIDLFTIRNFLGCIADLECSLKTLLLRFSFSTHLSAIENYNDAIGRYEVHIMNELIQDKGLQELIAHLNVENEIEIIIEGSYRTYHNDLALFLNSIAHMKGWTIIELPPWRFEWHLPSGIKLVGPLSRTVIRGDPPVATVVDLRTGIADQETLAWILKPATAEVNTDDPETTELVEEVSI